ncbi:MAG: HAD family phosphatase [Phycisphaerales bacterium]
MDTKAIIFDMGRVLVDLDIRKGLFGLFISDFSDKPDNSVQKIMDNPIFKKYNQGDFTPDEFYKELKSIFKIDISFDEFKFRWCSIFSIMPGMYELVEDLSKRYPLGLLSDTDPLHWNFLKEKYEILKFFKNPVLSYQARRTKPSSEIFQLAAQSVRTEPRNCLYIDDLKKNLEGAQSIGMKGIKFESTEQLKSELLKLGIL